MNEVQRRKKEANYLMLISKIIHEDVTNVNVSLTTVVDVKLSNDGSHLKVYVLFNNNEAKSLEALNNSKGFIRSQLANYSNTRSVPNLVFQIDTVSKQNEKLDKIFQQIKEQEKSKKGNDEQE